MFVHRVRRRVKKYMEIEREQFTAIPFCKKLFLHHFCDLWHFTKLTEILWSFYNKKLCDAYGSAAYTIHALGLFFLFGKPHSWPFLRHSTWCVLWKIQFLVAITLDDCQKSNFPTRGKSLEGKWKKIVRESIM